MLTRRLLFASVIPTPYIPPQQPSLKKNNSSSKTIRKDADNVSSDKFINPVYNFRSDVKVLNDYAFSFDSYIVADNDQNTFIHFTKTKWFDIINMEFVEEKEKKVFVVGKDFM